MEIKTGTARFVIIIHSLGIVLKMPMPHPAKLFRLMRDIVKNNKAAYFVFKYEMKHFHFRGVLENWREYSFWSRTRNSFLQPTYFSLFGLINIQKLGKPLETKEVNLFHQVQYYTKWFCWEHCHTFENPSNYCLDEDGKVRMLDYGNLYAQKVIERFGEICHEKISMTFDLKKDVLEGNSTINTEYIAFREERDRQRAQKKS